MTAELGAVDGQGTAQRAVRSLVLTTGAALLVAAGLLWVHVGVVGAEVVSPTTVTAAAGVAVGSGTFAVLAWPPSRWRLRRRRPVGRATLWAVIAVRATAEEVAWRGSLLALVHEHGRWPVWLALTSIGFGLVHDRSGRLGPTAAGAAFGALALAAGDVVSACVAHTMFNVAMFEIAHGTAASTAEAQASQRRPARQEVSDDRPQPPAMVGDVASGAVPVLAWASVSKRLGRVRALDDFSLEVDGGGITVLLGPNGAGKTTAVGLALGLRRPDTGTVRVLGRDPRAGRPGSRGGLAVGSAPQDVSFPMTMRVAELVEFGRAHYEHPHTSRDVLAWCGLAELAERQAGGLSGGQRRRLALALALIGRPQLVVLDEPTAGLDVEARQALWERLRWVRAQGRSVLLTTHDLTEAEHLADRIAVVDRGCVVAVDSPDRLRRTLGTTTMRFEVAGDVEPTLRAVLGGIDVTVARVDERSLVVTVVSAETDELVRRLVGGDVAFRRLRLTEASLEDAIRSISGR